MRFGKICEVHPELKGKRYDSYHCVACASKQSALWGKTKKGKKYREDYKKQWVLDNADHVREYIRAYKRKYRNLKKEKVK